MDQAEIFTGRCQCGQLGYRVSGRSLALFACHCRDCQRQSASAFGLALWVRTDEVALSGEPKTWIRETPGGRRMHCRFCPDCGSRVLHQLEDQPGVLSIKPGTLDDTRSLRPVAQLWTGRAQPWLSQDEGCLLYPGNPPGFEAIFAAWRQRRAGQ